MEKLQMGGVCALQLTGGAGGRVPSGVRSRHAQHNNAGRRKDARERPGRTRRRTAKRLVTMRLQPDHWIYEDY